MLTYLHAAAHLAHAKSAHHYVQHMEELNSEVQHLFEFGKFWDQHLFVFDKLLGGVRHDHTAGINEGHQHVWRTRDF